MTPGGAHRWPVSLQHGPVGLRPLRARDENFWYEVRARNASWTRPWDATRPDEATDAGLTFRQLVRQFNADARAGRALPWAITWTEPGEPPVLVGQLTISELRERSAKALGPKFDLRAFNDEVLNTGSVPLEALEKRIDAWILEQKGR